MVQESNRKISTISSQEPLQFDDALDVVGSGRYSLGLLLVCSIIQLGSGIDMFGFNLILPTASCDLDMTLQQQGILSSLPFMGVILVSYWWGYLSDTRGRRRVLLYSMYVSFALSILSSFSFHWMVLALIKFFSVCFSCAANAGTYTLLGECCPVKIRSRNMLLMSSAIVFVHVFTASIAYFILPLTFAPAIPFLGITFRPWRLLIIMMSLPSGIGAMLLHFFYESPKFLAHCGRHEEAMDVLRKMYAVNKRVQKEQFPVKSIVLEEYSKKKDENDSLLVSMWRQTAPLFQPPMLLTTLRLFYLIVVVYATNNSFAIWLPHIYNSFFEYLEKGNDMHTLCDLLSNSPKARQNPVEEMPICNDTLSNSTLYTMLFQSTILTVLNIVVARLSSWKKIIFIVCLTGSAICGISMNLMPEPISSIVIFLIFRLPSLCNGVIPAYFVELYPTSHRGMVACLGMMVGRLSSVVGINIVGNVIFSYCHTTFYSWAVFLISGAALAFWYLPTDKVKKEEKTAL